MKDNRLLKSIILTVILLLTVVFLFVCSMNGEGQAVEVPKGALESSAVIEEETEKTIVIDTWQPDEEEVEALAKLIYREARGCSTMEQAAVIWCVLNRVDSAKRYFPDTVLEVIKQPNQFAYIEDTPIWPAHVSLAEDVLQRWHEEKNGAEDVGRVLPAGYMYFVGDGKHNYFTQEFRSREYWTWSLPSPYGEE